MDFPDSPSAAVMYTPEAMAQAYASLGELEVEEETTTTTCKGSTCPKRVKDSVVVHPPGLEPGTH